MKNLVFILLFVLFSSCTVSKYEREIRFVDTGEIALKDTIVVDERANFRGEDASCSISVLPVETNDTIYNIYKAKVRDFINSTEYDKLFSKPVYISKFKYLK